MPTTAFSEKQTTENSAEIILEISPTKMHIQRLDLQIAHYRERLKKSSAEELQTYRKNSLKCFKTDLEHLTLMATLGHSATALQLLPSVKHMRSIKACSVELKKRRKSIRQRCTSLLVHSFTRNIVLAAGVSGSGLAVIFFGLAITVEEDKKIFLAITIAGVILGLIGIAGLVATSHLDRKYAHLKIPRTEKKLEKVYEEFFRKLITGTKEECLDYLDNLPAHITLQHSEGLKFLVRSVQQELLNDELSPQGNPLPVRKNMLPKMDWNPGEVDDLKASIDLQMPDNDLYLETSHLERDPEQITYSDLQQYYLSAFPIKMNEAFPSQAIEKTDSME